jgi:HlyD family secretion protein
MLDKNLEQVLPDRSGRRAGVKEPITPQPDDGRRWIRWTISIAIVVVVVVGAYLTWSRLRGASESSSGSAREATVQRRDFVRTIRFHGTVGAVSSYSVAAPRLGGQRGGPGGGAMTITKLLPAGSKVQKGDLLLEFDHQQQERDATDQENSFKDFEEQIKKFKANLDADRARDDTEMQQARNAVEAARLEMRKNEVISRIDAEKNKQNLDEAEATLKQLQQTYDLKRQSDLADLRSLEIQRDRAQKALVHAQENTQKMSISAPMEGMVVLNTTFRIGSSGPTDYQEGDDARPGAVVLNVVDPDRMEVRSRINQADIGLLKVGQPTQVRLDAYPDLVFSGRVERIAAIGVASSFSSKVHYFSAIFSVQGSDPKLLPDLSAAVDVELERIPNVLVIPRDAVFTEGSQSYVRVKKGAGFERRTVKTGTMSDYEAVIESGLQPGEIVERAAGRAPGSTP